MANAFGTITIVDMTDVGQFSTVPMSNAGLVIIYDPNALSNQYTPTSMTLTPFTMYGGADYSSHANVSYSWYKRVDGASINYSSPGTATSTNNSITISSNDFTSVNAKSITYYLKATYNATGIGNIIAWGQITISLVSQASNIQDIEISGEHIFKYTYTAYGSNPSIDGNDTIILTATYTSNVAVHQWYYYKKTTVNGNVTWSWETLPINGNNKVTINGSTCTIKEDAPIFYDNKAKIKVTAHRTDNTSVELTSVYDEYEILKLYDGPVGAPGEKSIAIILSNEDQMIPCDGNGNPAPDVTTAFSLASTTIEVLEGNRNVITNNESTGYKVVATPTGVISTNGLQYDSTNHIYSYKVDGWANNNASSQGYVTFTATRTDYPPLTKVMSLTKIQTGQDGKTPTIYELSITPNRVTTDSDGDTTSAIDLVAAVTAHTVSTQTSEAVNTDVTTSSTDIIYYQWFVNGSSSVARAGAGNAVDGNGISYSIYKISNNTRISLVICKIRRTNASGVILDSQSVSFVPEGAQGDTGATGDAAITLSFPQNIDTIGLNNDGTLASTYVLDMPYTVFQGTTQLNAQAVNTVSKGYSFSINDLDFTGNAKGSITFGSTKVTITIPNGTKVFDSTITGVNAHSLNGQCIIPIDYSGATQTAADGTVSTVSGTILATFSWNLDIAPASGTSIGIVTDDTWVRYKRTSNTSQPTITKNDAISVSAAQSGGTKPYYIWCLNRTTYTDGNVSDVYTVDYYAKDPVNGETPNITSTKSYACTQTNTAVPADNSNLWKSTINAAIAQAGLSKPYYIWERTIISYSYATATSQNTSVTTYSSSYYPADVIELTLQANSSVFNGTINQISISPIVTKNGSAYVPLTSELTWSYILNGNMTPVTSTSTSANIYRIDSGNTHNLIIKPDAINGSNSIQCALMTSGQTIYAYLPISDNIDEFKCDLYSTIGDKITNSQGEGFVECLLYRNGYEIDKITSGPVITSERSTGSSPHAAVINTVTEMNASTKPSNISDISAITYTWNYLQVDSSGNLVPLSDSTYNATGKAIYIDGTMIDKKIMINCEVTITYVTVS